MTALHPRDAAIARISARRDGSMTSIAGQAIEEMIVSGDLVAGDRINESALAEQLGVSRGPIREACRSLEQAGLLQSRANRGMYVRQVSQDEARDLYELRGAVAGLAGRVVAERASDAEIEALDALVSQMQAAADDAATERYYRLNLDFHDSLVRFTHNAALEETYRRIVNQLHLLRRRGLVQEGNLQTSNAEHKAIVAALLARDGPAASAAMTDHVANGLTRLLSAL